MPKPLIFEEDIYCTFWFAPFHGQILLKYVGTFPSVQSHPVSLIALTLSI